MKKKERRLKSGQLLLFEIEIKQQHLNVVRMLNVFTIYNLIQYVGIKWTF